MTLPRVAPVLDHVFTDAIGALRDVFENNLLERQTFEERFQADILLGDLTWQTSYGLPGEGLPPRVRADITLEWPTWAQSAYRSWYIGEDFDEEPTIQIEIVLRIQRLAEEPDPRGASWPSSPRRARPSARCPSTAPPRRWRRCTRPTSTQRQWAVEVSYEGLYLLDDAALKDGSALDEHFAAMGGWIASTLVRLGDLQAHVPPGRRRGLRWATPSCST